MLADAPAGRFLLKAYAPKRSTSRASSLSTRARREDRIRPARPRRPEPRRSSAPPSRAAGCRWPSRDEPRRQLHARGQPRGGRLSSCTTQTTLPDAGRRRSTEASSPGAGSSWRWTRSATSPRSSPSAGERGARGRRVGRRRRLVGAAWGNRCSGADASAATCSRSSTRSVSSCHPVAYPYLDLRRGRSYDDLVRVSAATKPAFERVVPGRPELSYLLVHPPDPSLAGLLTADDRRVIAEWIRAGARDDSRPFSSSRRRPCRGVRRPVSSRRSPLPRPPRSRRRCCSTRSTRAALDVADVRDPLRLVRRAPRLGAARSGVAAGAPRGTTAWRTALERGIARLIARRPVRDRLDRRSRPSGRARCGPRSRRSRKAPTSCSAPRFDGGYWLIAMARPIRSRFARSRGRRPPVLAATRVRCRRRRPPTRRAARAWRDLDTARRPRLRPRRCTTRSLRRARRHFCAGSRLLPDAAVTSSLSRERARSAARRGASILRDRLLATTGARPSTGIWPCRGPCSSPPSRRTTSCCSCGSTGTPCGTGRSRFPPARSRRRDAARGREAGAARGGGRRGVALDSSVDLLLLQRPPEPALGRLPRGRRRGRRARGAGRRAASIS